MSARALFPAIVCCAALLGCATSPFGPDGKTFEMHGSGIAMFKVAVSCSLGFFAELRSIARRYKSHAAIRPISLGR